MLLLFRSGVEINPGPGPVQAGIEAAFAAGSRKKRGRPKSVGADTSGCRSDSEHLRQYVCDCGKTFSNKRNLVQHQDRCPILTKRAVTPVCSKRNKTNPSICVLTCCKPAQPPKQPIPVTLYSQNDDMLKLISSCKYTFPKKTIKTIKYLSFPCIY